MNKYKYRLTLFIILLGILSSCSYRTPSQERFSKALDVYIPKEVEVIRDEYQDMLQDYSIYYNIRLSQSQMTEFIQSIKKSKYYNADLLITKYFSEKMLIKYDNNKAVWGKTKTGYMFRSVNDLHTFSAKIDTMNNLASFNEGSD